MKGKEIIEFIKNNNLEEFQIDFCFVDGNASFPNARTFKVTGVSDIGHSEQTMILEGEES